MATCSNNGITNERDFILSPCTAREYCAGGICTLKSNIDGPCTVSVQCYESYCSQASQGTCLARKPLGGACQVDTSVLNAQCEWPYTCTGGTCALGSPHLNTGPPTCMDAVQQAAWEAFLPAWADDRTQAKANHKSALVQAPIYFVDSGAGTCRQGGVSPTGGGGGEEEDFFSEYGLYLGIAGVVMFLCVGLLVFCLCCRKGRGRGGGGGTYRDENGHHVSNADHGYTKKQLAALERQHAMPQGPAWMSGGGDIFMGGGHVGFFPGEGGGGISYVQPEQSKSFSEAGRVSFMPEASSYSGNAGHADNAQSRYQASKERDAQERARRAGGQVKTREQQFDGW